MPTVNSAGTRSRAEIKLRSTDGLIWPHFSSVVVGLDVA
jgi:hypothetical protein